MRRFSLIDHFDWVEMIYKRFNEKSIPPGFIKKCTREEYRGWYLDSTLNEFLYYALLYSVIEGLEKEKFDIWNRIPELNKKIHILNVDTIRNNKIELPTFHTMMRQCRNATFHIPDDNDRKKSYMNFASSMLYNKELVTIHEKVRIMIDEIKDEVNYEEYLKSFNE